MNNELVANLDNAYIINGLFDEIHLLGKTINITSKKYYSTLTNHIAQLSDLILYTLFYQLLTFQIILILFNKK